MMDGYFAILLTKSGFYLLFLVVLHLAQSFGEEVHAGTHGEILTLSDFNNILDFTSISKVYNHRLINPKTLMILGRTE